MIFLRFTEHYAQESPTKRNAFKWRYYTIYGPFLIARDNLIISDTQLLPYIRLWVSTTCHDGDPHLVFISIVATSKEPLL